MNDILLATFHLDDYLCAVPAADVQEVLMEQPRTPTPGAPSCIAGLINLRGQVVSTLDLRSRLGLADRDGQTTEPVPTTSVVVRWQDEVWCLIVDRIGDVIEVGQELFEPPPDTLGGSVRDLITGAYKLESSLLLMLDMQELLTISGEPAAH